MKFYIRNKPFLLCLDVVFSLENDVCDVKLPKQDTHLSQPGKFTGILQLVNNSPQTCQFHQISVC